MGILKRYSKTFLTLFASFFIVTLAACDGGNGTIDDNTTVVASLAVTSTAPASGSTTAGIDTKIVAVFNRAMMSDTITQTSFKLQSSGGTDVVGPVTYNADTQTAIFTPNGGLSPSTLYTATITTAVKGETNTALLNSFVWTFTTAATTDSTRPELSSNSPSSGATDVVRNTKVSVVFDEAIDPATVINTNFRLTQTSDSAEVAGSLKYVNPNTVLFTPDVTLGVTVAYTFIMGSGVADLADNNLVATSFEFSTGSAESSSPVYVELGGAGNYVILSKTGITTTGTTDVTGDIAVSPEALTAITGFGATLDSSGTFATSSLVTGELFAANMTTPTPAILTTAVENMLTAYTDAAGRSNPDFTELGAGEIGGLTLDPGLYKWGTGVLVTSDVTLNGSATDRWIFQIGQDLKLQDGKAIVLTGGALPENVYWQVAGEVTLQAGATFNGIILSQTGVILKSGAVLNGRALAQTAVTLIANDVNEPAQ